MNARRVVTRCGLAAAFLSLAASGQAAASASKTMLRYHFTAGQTIGYQLSQTSTIAATQGGRLLPGEQDRTSALEQYRFLSVDPTAVHAKLLIHTSKATQTARQAGKVLTVRPTVPDQKFTLSRDGWETSAGMTRGGYSVYDFGILADHAVKVGDRWTSIIENTVGIPKATLACTNTLTRIEPATKGPLATVTTGCKTTTGRTVVTIAAGPFAGTATEVLGATWQFDVTAGRFAGEQVTRTVVLTGTLSTAKADVHYGLREVDHVSLVLATATGGPIG